MIASVATGDIYPNCADTTAVSCLIRTWRQISTSNVISLPELNFCAVYDAYLEETIVKEMYQRKHSEMLTTKRVLEPSRNNFELRA